MAIITPLALVFVITLCYKITTHLLRKRHNARQAALLGCLPPADAPRKGLFGIGTLRESIRATRDEWGPIWMHQSINSIGKNVHTVKASIFDYELIITRDVENVQAIFASQAHDWDIGTHRERCFKSLLGPGVMTNRQTKWKHSRRLIRPQFGRDNIADLGLFQRHLNSLLRRIQMADGGWTDKTDLSTLFFNLTLDTGTEFLFGQSVHVQDPIERSKSSLSWDFDAPDLSSFGKHLDEAKHIIDRRGALAKYGWLLRDSAYPDHCKAVQEIVDYFVKKRLSRGRDEEKEAETQTGKSKFVLLNELTKETQDPLELRCELLNVLHASRDTTGSLMGWVFYFLARHPRVFSLLRQEIISTCGEDPTTEVTFAQIWSCRYMVNVLNEVIRIIGIVPMNERAALRDTTLPRGGGPDGTAPVFVPEGTQVLIPTYSMQHREDIWGEDVEEFKPERWENRNSRWDFLPFGGGIRQCIGQQFARTETMFVVVRMVQIFDRIENMEGPGPIKMHHTIENRSGTGVQVRLHLASPSFSGYCEEQKRDLDLRLGDDCDLGLGAERETATL
ncbi:hypothetical protein H2200_004140 [Cladophialophora chaetospira]|uniref:Cytochrome P450 n=1 Tax=Cladophialophora chaetospira TaxID=386627 RepID=A0AA39CLT4_9EURO|nr:hypothetical protein H2200_004140 [Cladophialophora chaetospira]